MDIVKRALNILSETLDPPTDQYSARQSFSHTTWQPGERIEDFFFSARRKAAEANVDMRFIALLVSAQLPREVEAKIKTMITDIDPDLSGEGGRRMLVTIKKELQDLVETVKDDLDLQNFIGNPNPYA